MKNWEIVRNQMTAEQLKAKMIAEADVKLRTILSDVDPFWVRWSFWFDELDRKEKDAIDTLEQKDKEIEGLKEGDK